MPNRFWEIGLGSLIFLKSPNDLFSKPINIYLSALISGLLIGVLFLPIKYGLISTLLLVFLTAYLIYILNFKGFIFQLLTSRLATSIGLLSYSLYLWHWGVISMSHWTVGIHSWSIPFQLILIFTLSIATYKFVEIPFKKMVWSEKKIKTLSLGILSVCVSFLIVSVFEKEFKNKLFLGDKQEIFDNNLDGKYYDLSRFQGRCELQRNELNNLNFAKCLLDKKSTRTFYFIGDSHNLSFLKGAEEIANRTESNLKFAQTDLFPKIGLSNKKLRLFESQYKRAYENIEKGDIVFIINRMPFRFIQEWYEIDKYKNETNTTKNFENWIIALKDFSKTYTNKNIKIILFTPTPEFPEALLRKCKGQNTHWFSTLSQKDCSIDLKNFNSKDGSYFHLIKRLQDLEKEEKNIYLFDALKTMCVNSKCNYQKGKTSLFRDDDHITDYAAEYLIAPKLIEFLNEKKFLSDD